MSDEMSSKVLGAGERVFSVPHLRRARRRLVAASHPATDRPLLPGSTAGRSHATTAILLLAAAPFAAALLGAAAAHGATITVTNATTGFSDDGECSLSEAIDNANADANDGILAVPVPPESVLTTARGVHLADDGRKARSGKCFELSGLRIDGGNEDD